jgi:ATP-dependent RNA helicase DeaD
MAEKFEQLGITPELSLGVAGLGWREPVALQRDAVPLLRRGNNVILHASAGSGAVGAYGLGLVDRLLRGAAGVAGGEGGEAMVEGGEGGEDGEAGGGAGGEAGEAGEAGRGGLGGGAEREGGGPRLLVLVPTADAASRVAESLARLGAGAALTVRALAAGWPDRAADVLVVAAAQAASAMRDSSLKLESVVGLVVDGADQLAETGQWEAVELVAESVPAKAQRVVVTGRLDARVEGFAERHVRRALTIPARPAEEAAGPAVGTVRYVPVPEAGKTAVLVGLLSEGEAGEVAVVCRDGGRAERVAATLAARGLPAVAGEAAEEAGVGRILVLPWPEADRRSQRAEVVSYDVPFDAEALETLHGRGGTVLATPRELPHLQRIARRAALRLSALRLPEPEPLLAAEAVRERLRQVLGEVDLAADLALVEPLLEEYPAPEVAAAALHLARAAAPGRAERGAGAAGTAGATGVGTGKAAEKRAPAAHPSATTGAPPPEASWVRLFVSAGSRDGLGPGDLVGAISGETAVPGDQVGRIDIRESHSTVEVPAASAEAVIRALNGRSLRGRSLRVDYDRKERTPRPGPSGGERGGPSRGGPPRGGPPRGGPSRGGPSRGGPSRGGPSRGGSSGGPSRGGPPRGGGRSGPRRPSG